MKKPPTVKEKQPAFPRIRNLPKVERAPFKKWLTGQTCPWLEGVPDSEQDAYYPWDFFEWKRRKILNKNVPLFVKKP